MRCRYANRVVFVRAVVFGLVAVVAAGVAAKEAPIEVYSVDLRTNETLGTVVLGAEKQVEWSTDAKSRTLVVFLPHTVPGPEALDRSSRMGLISLVEVGFAVPGGVPTTRVTVHARRSFSHEVEGSGAGLTIRLRAAASKPRSPAPTGAAEPVTAEVESSVDSEEFRKALEETEHLRKRVAELHSDRLELRESLARARKELAEQPAVDVGVRAVELERENARLVEELRSQRARLAGSEEASNRTEARIRELRQRLEAAEDQTEATNLANENQPLNTELCAQKSALAQSRRESAQLSARVREMETDAAAQAFECADGLSVGLAERAARAQQLARQLRESRSETTSLRAWLSKAPEVLGASTFVVSTGDSCLPLRPEPTSTSAVLKCLPSGSRLEALSFRPDWLRVRAEEGKEGWVSAAGISPPESVADAAVRKALDESLSEAASLRDRVAGLEGELLAAQSRAVERPSQASGLAEMKSQLDEERKAREAAEGDLRVARSRNAELEAAATQLPQVETRSAESSRELDLARQNLSEAREEIESQKRKLRALVAQVSLGQPMISEDADPCLSLRAGPGTEHRRLDCLDPRTPVSVEDAAVDWLSIKTASGLSGWVASRFIQSNSVVADSERADREALAASVAELDRLKLEVEAAEARNRASLDRFEEADAMRKELDRALANLKAQQEVERTEALSALKVSRVVVNDDVDSCLSLRVEPRVDSRSLDCLAPGTEAATVALSGGWFRLRLQDDREGWSSGEFVESVDQRELRRLAQRATELDENLNRERDALRRVQQELVERDERIADLNNQVAEGGEAGAELERMSRSLDESREELARMTSELEQAENRRVVDLNSAQQDRARLEGQIEAAREEINRLGPLTGQAGETPILQAALENARRELESSEARNTQFAAELTSTRESLSESEASREILAGHAASLEAAQQAVSNSNVQRAALQRQVRGLQADLKTTRESLASAEARNQALEAEAKRQAQLTVVAVQPAPIPEPDSERELRPAEAEAAEPSEAQIAWEAPGVEEIPMATVEPGLPSPNDLRAFAEAWARAWSQQRVDDYLSYYAPEFVPPRGMNRSQWADLRRDRLTHPSFIDVTLSNYRTRIDGPDRAMVAFDQEYRSDTFQDRVVKTLELVRDGDLWRIQAEIAN